MSVTLRPYRRGGWEVDLRIVLPDGTEHRQRRKAPVTSKSAAQRWGDDRERVWFRALMQPKDSKPKKEVPTLEQFAERFVDGHARANQHKPSGIAGKLSILNHHLKPFFKDTKLDEISTEDIQRLKVHLGDRAPKTVNNVLTVLSMLLKVAVEWGILDRVPCTIRLLKTPKTRARFHDVDAYEALVKAAEALDWRAELIVLLAGEASLRCGEIMALEWTDVDWQKPQLCVERSDWKGQVTATKGGRVRYVPLTHRLAAALKKHRHLRSRRVLHRDNPKRSPLTQKIVQDWVARAAQRAKVPAGVHVLRHSFCSHLAMKGAPARAIQELAGHQDLGTTQRYMHLSPSAIDQAIRLLDKATG
jgi:integrase